MNNTNTFETKEKQREHDRFIAISMLRALVDSTFKDELQHYWTPVQEHLKLDDEDMNRLFDLETIVDLLAPTETYKRYFHGKRVETWIKTPMEEKPKLNKANIPLRKGVKRVRLYKTPSAIIDPPSFNEDNIDEIKEETKGESKKNNNVKEESAKDTKKESFRKIVPRKLDFTMMGISEGLMKLSDKLIERVERIDSEKQFAELLNSSDSVKEESVEEISENNSDNEIVESKVENVIKNEVKNEVKTEEPECKPELSKQKTTKKEPVVNETSENEDENEEETEKEHSENEDENENDSEEENEEEKETETKKEEPIITTLKKLLTDRGFEDVDQYKYELNNSKCPNSVLFSGKNKQEHEKKEFLKTMGKYNMKYKVWVLGKKKINRQYKKHLSKQKKQAIEIAEKE